MFKYISGDATASGDTTKTSLGTITTPVGTKRLVGMWSYIGVADTTIEQVSGIVTLESDDVNLQPFQVPVSGAGGSLTSGGRAMGDPKVYPIEVPVPGQVKITGYITLDAALTINAKARWGLVIEV